MLLERCCPGKNAASVGAVVCEAGHTVARATTLTARQPRPGRRTRRPSRAPGPRAQPWRSRGPRRPVASGRGRGPAGTRPRTRRRSRSCRRPRSGRPGPARCPPRRPAGRRRRRRSPRRARPRARRAILQPASRSSAPVKPRTCSSFGSRTSRWGRAGAIHSSTPMSPGARMSAEVCRPASRARERISRRGLAAHELGAAHVQLPRTLEERPVDVARSVGAVGADHVERGPRAVRTDREHARRGLDVRAPQEPRGVHAVLLQQREQQVAGGVGPDRAHAGDLAPELGEDEPRAAGGPGGGDADLLHERAALALRDLLDGADEHVEDVHPHDDRAHQRASWAAGRVDP